MSIAQSMSEFIQFQHPSQSSARWRAATLLEASSRSCQISSVYCSRSSVRPRGSGSSAAGGHVWIQRHTLDDSVDSWGKTPKGVRSSTTEKDFSPPIQTAGLGRDMIRSFSVMTLKCFSKDNMSKQSSTFRPFLFGRMSDLPKSQMFLTIFPNVSTGPKIIQD